MKQILYLEVPTPDTAAVRQWLQQQFQPALTSRSTEKQVTPDGCRLRFLRNTHQSTQISEKRKPLAEKLSPEELSIFTWSVQRTTYLKVFRWSEQSVAQEAQLLAQLTQELRSQFPQRYPAPPTLDLTKQSIFEALAPYYPKTAKYFRSIPNGEYDLTRVYWWEQRWRSGVQQPQSPKQVIFKADERSPADRLTPVSLDSSHLYDLIYIGGALGVIHAAVMAQLGYRVLLIERLPFGRMNREWNISRQEFQTLIDLGLFTPAEFETVIACEYEDGFNKFFDANNPPQAKAPVLHTPTVLNIALDAEKLLQLCGEKLRSAGGEIWDETEFNQAETSPNSVTVETVHLPTQTTRVAIGRILVDAMGTASPIAWQLNHGRAFDSVCPTVGAVIDGGFEPGVWDSRYGDVLNSHGDISRGRQLIWELFPGKGEELTFYLFHYHQVHPDNPGSLLEMYEDFFTILPEYRRCEVEKLRWKKATFGYIPGHFSIRGNDRRVAFDRLVAIGDAASLQSPLVFTGFGSLVRNLPRLTELLDTALRHNLTQAKYLNQIRAYQSNIAVTWLFSKGMMVPTGRTLPPERVNAMLNTFFGILASESPQVADRFIKDRAGWLPFNRMAIKAAAKNPALLLWIWDMAGRRDLIRWVGSYINFTVSAMISWLLRWLPDRVRSLQTWLEPRNPALWFWLLSQSYALTYGVGKPRPEWIQHQRQWQSPETPPIVANPVTNPVVNSTIQLEE
ncbi:NAD(P)/FAD-dependent oxidoreductase [Thermocoleostomius sinensis]|uniref:Flavin-dependent dehydrogenase n=1 Tax=Thermocoleostomius sinensis A174 TaxID=2016057 RepID=A0A9E9C891_9CYAN|nr:flavin-dependent dehydrogenase [Thermocoleostomius sinensis]WAL61174.1 flavin-dependent dehydrogenase [Thermocoleostomius sinensis A174]